MADRITSPNGKNTVIANDEGVDTTIAGRRFEVSLQTTNQGITFNRPAFNINQSEDGLTRGTASYIPLHLYEYHGDLIGEFTPTLDEHATTKKYVDDKNTFGDRRAGLRYSTTDDPNMDRRSTSVWAKDPDSDATVSLKNGHSAGLNELNAESKGVTIEKSPLNDEDTGVASVTGNPIYYDNMVSGVSAVNITPSDEELKWDYTPFVATEDYHVTTKQFVDNKTFLQNASRNASIQVLDNGFISMNGPGGTFFLNEHGTAGFFANQDASLSGNNSCRVGAGNLVMGVEEGTFFFQQGPEVLRVTFDRLREVFEG